MQLIQGTVYVVHEVDHENPYLGLYYCMKDFDLNDLTVRSEWAHEVLPQSLDYLVEIYVLQKLPHVGLDIQATRATDTEWKLHSIR